MGHIEDPVAALRAAREAGGEEASHHFRQEYELALLQQLAHQGYPVAGKLAKGDEVSSAQETLLQRLGELHNLGNVQTNGTTNKIPYQAWIERNPQAFSPTLKKTTPARVTFSGDLEHEQLQHVPKYRSVVGHMDPERDWEKIRNSLPSAPRDAEMQSHSQWVPQGNGAAPPSFPASEGRLALGRPEAGFDASDINNDGVVDRAEWEAYSRRSAKMSAREELPPSKLEQCASQPPYQANSRSSYHNGLV